MRKVSVAEARSTGRTSNQMRAAPQGATYLWCNQFTQYAARLANSLGRSDLKIVSPAWLQNGWQGMPRMHVVVDHATFSKLSTDERAQLERLLGSHSLGV